MDQKGFTLIELVLVIILIAIIAAAFGTVLLPTMGAYVSVDTRKEAVQNARTAMDRMVLELRDAQSVAACGPCPPVNNITFTDIRSNNITYAWSGAAQTPLTRNGDSLSSNVDSFTVTYYKKDGTTPPADQTEIWRIELDLIIRVMGETVELRSNVNPRNFS